MKKRILAFFVLICSLFSVLAMPACGDDFVDYAAQVTLDMNSTNTIKQEVTVEAYIDGDTTHFKVPTSIVARGVLKARYAAVNTPESTGKIEEWGKKASNYTKTQLRNAVSIVIETDGPNWKVDSTGERYLVWVWYKSSETDVYHNLNLELLQQGLAVGSKASDSIYGELAVKAIDQANRFKLHVHSEDPDPDYYYGDAQEINLKELRLNIEDYVDARVAFNGYVTQYNNDGVFVEEYDQETDTFYGIYVYYGYDLTSDGEDILLAGNYVRIVGVVSYWETGKNYQVSDLEYDPFEPDNPENIQLLSQNNEVPYTETTAEKFLGKTTVTYFDEAGEEKSKQCDYAGVSIHTSISMKNLKVVSAYTTDNDGNNDGALTLTCTVDGKTVTIRTAVLLNPDFSVITKDKYLGKTIDVVGIIDSYNGEYQIKVFDAKDITIHA